MGDGDYKKPEDDLISSHHFTMYSIMVKIGSSSVVPMDGLCVLLIKMALCAQWENFLL